MGAGPTAGEVSARAYSSRTMRIWKRKKEGERERERGKSERASR
jgi:hypothetical protein